MKNLNLQKALNLITLIGLCVLIGATTVGTVYSQENQPRPAAGAANLEQVEIRTMSFVDADALRREDEQDELSGNPPRFAEPISVEFNPENSGTWETLKDNRLLWRLRIAAPGAVSLNFGWTRYRMPPSGRMLLYTPDEKIRRGFFTAQDNAAHGEFWSPIIAGGEVVIEVTLDADERSQLELNLTSVNYGYKDFSTLSPSSGSCNVDVVCSQGDAWRNEIRSVAVYSTGGSRACTGVLVNNTAQNARPFFLTANHCGINTGNAASVVTYWNYQNSFCRAPGSPSSGQAGDGSLSQFVSGAFFRAAYAPSDMTLIEMDEPIPAAYNAFFAGWDNTSVNPSSAVAIHHPNVEEKRISFENDPLTTTSFNNPASPGDGTHLSVTDYDLGTTEPGSSGAPLFNSAHRIVGQLNGGPAACGNNSSDYYGRFSLSWTGGGTAATRLKDWLDPNNTGATVLNGNAGGIPLIVTKTADTNDGACDADCSLREAIAAANAGDAIVFASPTFDAPQIIDIDDQFVISKSLTVTGNGANLLTIRNIAAPGPSSRIFLVNGGTVNLSGITITGGNPTGGGGGIVLGNDATTLTLRGVHVTGNTTKFSGGIHMDGGTLNVIESTISNNWTDLSLGGAVGSGGGGIDTNALNTNNVNITNSTISGNRKLSSSGNGGGIWINGNLTITNSTVTRNEADGGTSSAGGIYLYRGTAAVRNSIIASNCAILFNATCSSSDAPDVFGRNSPLTSQGYNIIGIRGTVTAFNQTGDRTGTGTAPLDPQLFPLRDNGGTTPTHALRSNSPAINPASSNGAPAADQRGSPRLGTADTGAFEFLDIVTNTNDSGAGSLRQVVADTPAGGSVIFSDFFRLDARTINLSSGQITINKNLEIVGLGANVLTVRNTQAQSSTSRVFNIIGGTVNLSGMTITGGNLSNFASNGGGGIFNFGNLTIFACHVTGNTDNNVGGGGGIFNINGGNAALTLINSTVSNNTATGGSSASGGIFHGGTALTVINSTVSGNRATGGNSGNGGGILAIGNAVIVNSTVTDNETGGSGGAGGIFKFNGTTVTIGDTIVAGNCTRTTGAICSQTTTPDVASVGGNYTSNGYNLIGNVGTAGGFTNTGDQTGSNGNSIINPQLAPLSNNGGTTPTHALLANSPAIDKGSSFAAASDQRGMPRPIDFPNFPNAPGGDGSDIGAFELQVQPTAANVTIEGRVLTPQGRGLTGARVTLTDQNGVMRTTITSTFGYFRFADAVAGETVVLLVASKRYKFTPQVLSITEDLSGISFVGQSSFGQR